MTINSTMRAAFFTPGNNKVVLKDALIPTPTSEQVLLKVAAAGVCHSDVYLLSDDILDSRTYVMGHETVGYAVEWGSNVKGIVKGQLYAVWASVPCAKAIAGFPPFSDSVGLGHNGGYAQYLVVNASELVQVPHGLAPEIAVLAADSLITVYNALHNVAELRPGTNKRVLIYGVGGLGHQAIQLAKSYGATVYACDFKPAARDLALSVGADQVFDHAELNAATADTAENPLTVDVAIDFVVNAQSFSLLTNAVKRAGSDLSSPGGTVVLVGVSADQLTITPIEYIIWHINVKTSIYGSLNDLKASLGLLLRGVVRPVVSTDSLENINEVLDALKANEVTGRKVILPNAGSGN